MKTTVALPTSSEITRRLRTVAELRNLCLSLGRARRVAERVPISGEQPVSWLVEPPVATGLRT